MNNDLQLCADFGTADKVREMCAGWDAEKLGKAAAAFYGYLKSGVMSVIPFTHFRIWATFSDCPKEQHDHIFQVVADTLYTMTGEARQREHPARVIVHRIPKTESGTEKRCRR